MKNNFETFRSDFAACQDQDTELGAKFFSALHSSDFDNYVFEACLNAMKEVYPGKYDDWSLNDDVCELVCEWLNSIDIIYKYLS